MSNKYSSDKEMQKLFEGFRKSFRNKSLTEGAYIDKFSTKKRVGSQITDEEYAEAEEYFHTYFKDMHYIGSNFRSQMDDWRMHEYYVDERESRAKKCTEDTENGTVCWYVLGTSFTDGFINPETGVINHGPSKGKQVFDPGAVEPAEATEEGE